MKEEKPDFFLFFSKVVMSYQGNSKRLLCKQEVLQGLKLQPNSKIWTPFLRPTEGGVVFSRYHPDEQKSESNREKVVAAVEKSTNQRSLDANATVEKKRGFTKVRNWESSSFERFSHFQVRLVSFYRLLRKAHFLSTR